MSVQKQIFYFTKSVTKSIKVLDTKKRLFEGIVTVEMVDKQGEITIRDELLKTFPIWMDRDAPIIDTHSNRVVGKGLNYAPVEVLDPKTKKKYYGIKILAKIHQDNQLDDDIWKKIITKEYRGFSFGGATRGDREPVEQADGSIAYSLKDLEMYEISVCAEPAVPLALITDFNHLAKSMKAEDMCGMSFDELDDGKIRVKCDGLKCYVIRDSDQEVMKTWQGKPIEVINLDDHGKIVGTAELDEPVRLNSNKSVFTNKDMTNEDIRKEEEDKKDEKDEEKKAEDDKKEEPKKDEEKKAEDDKKDDDKKEDADKSISNLADLVGTLVKTISSERNSTNKKFDKLAEQIKALETPAPAEEHGTNTPVKLNNEYNDEPGSDTRASEDPKDPADKESEDGSVEFEEKQEIVSIHKATTPRPSTGNDWINKNRDFNPILKRARELGPERMDQLIVEIKEGVYGKTSSNPEGYPVF